MPKPILRGRIIMNINLIKKQNFVLGVLILFLVSVFYLVSLNLPSDVQIFPKLVLYVMGVNAVVLIYKSTKESEQKKENFVFGNAIIIALSLLVLYPLLKILGFYVSLGVFFFYIYIRLNKGWNLQSVLSGVFLSVVFICILYIVFHVLMNLITPKGLLI